MYTFNSIKDFQRLINTERKASMKLYRETGEERYKKYANYCEYTISNNINSDPKEIEIENIKDFIVENWLTFCTRLDTQFTFKRVNKDSMYRENKYQVYKLLGEDFFNTTQLQ